MGQPTSERPQTQYEKGAREFRHHHVSFLRGLEALEGAGRILHENRPQEEFLPVTGESIKAPRRGCVNGQRRCLHERLHDGAKLELTERERRQQSPVTYGMQQSPTLNSSTIQ